MNSLKRQTHKCALAHTRALTHTHTHTYTHTPQVLFLLNNFSFIARGYTDLLKRVKGVCDASEKLIEAQTKLSSEALRMHTDRDKTNFGMCMCVCCVCVCVCLSVCVCVCVCAP